MAGSNQHKITSIIFPFSLNIMEDATASVSRELITLYWKAQSVCLLSKRSGHLFDCFLLNFEVFRQDFGRYLPYLLIFR